MRTVAIIDYGMCNLDSIARAVQECGGNALVTDRAEDLQKATAIILPGVGAFPDAMRNLQERHLPEILHEEVLVRGIPFLGICLGMQLLATTGYEVRPTRGLGWIKGEVRRLEPTAARERIPHIGWNEVVYTRACPLFKGIPDQRDFYFVHSYHVAAAHEDEVVARTPYCGAFACAVHREHIFGVQFHPEKSQRLGFQVLTNFLSI